MVGQRGRKGVRDRLFTVDMDLAPLARCPQTQRIDSHSSKAHKSAHRFMSRRAAWELRRVAQQQAAEGGKVQRAASNPKRGRTGRSLRPLRGESQQTSSESENYGAPGHELDFVWSHSS